MNKSAVIHARVEPGTKTQAEDVLRRLGLSPTEAIRLFYRQICLRKGLPFSVHLPNEATAKTLKKSRRGLEVMSVASLDEMFETWEE
jgi:DNA-damage-inducible protein J